LVDPVAVTYWTGGDHGCIHERKTRPKNSEAISGLCVFGVLRGSIYYMSVMKGMNGDVVPHGRPHQTMIRDPRSCAQPTIPIIAVHPLHH
jgi:hypothetical protein